MREGRRSDIDLIGPRIREIDALECRAYGHEPEFALRQSYRASRQAWTLEVDGAPVAMMGVGCGNLMERIGSPWMLGVEWPRDPRPFLTLARPLVAQMRELYPRLQNWAHRDNLSTLRWLRKLGFDVDAEVVHIGTEPFRRFSLGF